MIRSTLAFWFGNLFLFFYNCCARLDCEYASGLIEAMAALHKQAITQANYRQAVAHR